MSALEILLITPAVANYIRTGQVHQIPMAMQTGKGLGMQELTGALMDRVREGSVEPAEALNKAADREAMSKELARHGFMGGGGTSGSQVPRGSGAPAEGQTTRKMSGVEIDDARQRALEAARSGQFATKKKKWFS